MKKPTICFLGNRRRCYEIINHFNGSVKSNYIDGENNNEGILSYLNPALICFILEKGTFGHKMHYSAALNYSKRTMCPIYIICSSDQFDGMKKSCYKSVIHKVTELGLYRLIRNTIRLFRDFPDKNAALMKSRLDTVVVISSNAALAAYAENQICLYNTPSRRLLLSSPSSSETLDILENKDSQSGFIVTEPLNAVELERISLELSKLRSPEIPVIMLENNEHYKLKGGFRRFSIKDNDDGISKEFSRAYKAKIKKISYGKDKKADENSL